MSEHLALYGYAPGNYECRCYLCKETFVGDKRATTCKRCAGEAAVRQRLNEVEHGKL